MNSFGHGTAVSVMGVVLLLLIVGCSDRTIHDPLIDAWDQRMESIGSQYTVELVSETGQLAADVGGEGDPEVIKVKCVRQGAYYAVEIIEPNGDQYVRLKNAKYCAVLSRPNNEEGYKIDRLAPLESEDYQSESWSILKLDPISSLMTGNFLVDYYRAAGSPVDSYQPGAAVYRYNVAFDREAIKEIVKAKLETRLIPREFQIEVSSSPGSGDSDRWLRAWEWRPISIVDDEVLELPRRRVTVEAWTKFAELNTEIPSSFDFWTDESGGMIRNGNRQITSFSNRAPNDSAVFFLNGYDLSEVPLRGGNWNPTWILAGILAVGVVGYLFLPRLFQNH